jgi:hypothetical protein
VPILNDRRKPEYRIGSSASSDERGLTLYSLPAGGRSSATNPQHKPVSSETHFGIGKVLTLLTAADKQIEE